MAFPADPLGIQVEIFAGGGWVDITDDVRVADGISVTRGRADEAARVDPSRCTLTLDNRDGKYSPRNPLSPLYGLIGRNTAVRVSVEGSVRFTGEISSWPSRWDVSGANVVLPVEAAGILRRLGQGAAVLGSAMYRGRVFDTAGLVAYWPCEDPEGSTSIMGALNHGPMTVIGGPPQFAAYDGFASSHPIPVLNDSEWRGSIPAYAETGAVQVRWLMHVPAAGTEDGDTIVLVYTTGSVRRWEVFYGAGGALGLRAFDANGTQLFTTGGVAFDVNGKRLMCSVELQQDGSAVDWNLLTLEPGAPSGLTFAGALNSNTIGRAGTVIVSPHGGITNVAIGHVSVQNTITSLFDLGAQLASWAGERAGRRIERLCEEEGIAFQSVGDLDGTAALGPQHPAALLDLLWEAAETDLGILFESRDELGLTYRTRTSLYNQTAAVALDYAAGHLVPPLEPVDDDQHVRNDITVTREGGSSARAVQESGPLNVSAPPAGVGRYDEEVTISTWHDQELSGHAWWRLRLGTVDETRYPRLTLNLVSPRLTTVLADVIAADLGDLLTVDTLPPWLPPGRVAQIIQGYEEQFGPFDWTITANCTPGSPWMVGVFNDSGARYQPLASVLADDLDESSTSMTVDTPAGPLWSTSATGYDLLVGGERMTVSAVGSASGTEQTFTVVRAVNGVAKGHAAGTPVEMFTPTVYAL